MTGESSFIASSVRTATNTVPPIILNADNATTLIVPGGGFLLDAEFHRAGPDLVLHGEDGRQVIITGYFNQSPPPVLTTATGATISPELAAKLAGPAAPGQLAQAAAAQHMVVVGKVDKLTGTVEVIHPDGTRSTLSVGDVIYQGDIIITKADGTVGITFADSSSFSLGKSGRMVIDELVFDPAAQTGQSAFSVIKGTFSFVSGQIAKTSPDATTIKTPVMTIGVRGTSLAGTAGAEGEENSVILLMDPDGSVGQITITNAGGTTVVDQPNYMVNVSSFIQPPSPPIYVPTDVVEQTYGEVIQSNPNPPQSSVAPPSDLPGTQNAAPVSNDRETDDVRNDVGNDGGNNSTNDIDNDQRDSNDDTDASPAPVSPSGTTPPSTVTELEVVTPLPVPNTVTDAPGANTGSNQGNQDLQTEQDDRNDEGLKPGGSEGGAEQQGPSSSGRVIDGYVRNATVFRDMDGDGSWDPDEYGTTTGANGEYVLRGEGGIIVAYGGIDTVTNLPLTITMKAPAGSSVVTPLTTMVVAVMAGKSVGAAEAEAIVKGKLGLEGITGSLLTTDPIAGMASGGSTGAEAKAMMAMIAKIVVTINAVAMATGGAIDAQKVLDTIASKLVALEDINLNSPSTLEMIISFSGTGLNSSVITALANALAACNTAMDTLIESASSFAAVGAALQGVLSPGGEFANLVEAIVENSLDLSNVASIKANLTALKQIGLTKFECSTGEADFSAAEAAGLELTLQGEARARVIDNGSNLSAHLANIHSNFTEYVLDGGDLRISLTRLNEIGDRLTKLPGSPPSTITCYLSDGDTIAFLDSGYWEKADSFVVEPGATVRLSIGVLQEWMVTPGANAKIIAAVDIAGEEDLVGADYLNNVAALEVPTEAFVRMDGNQWLFFHGNGRSIDVHPSARLFLELDSGDYSRTPFVNDNDQVIVDRVTIVEEATVTLSLAQWDALGGEQGVTIRDGATIDIVITEDADLREPHHGIANVNQIRWVTVASGVTVTVDVEDLNEIGFANQQDGTIHVMLHGDVREYNLSLGDTFEVAADAKVTLSASLLYDLYSKGKITLSEEAEITVSGNLENYYFDPDYIAKYVDHNINTPPQALPSTVMPINYMYNVVDVGIYAFDPDGDPITITINGTGTTNEGGYVEQLSLGMFRYHPPSSSWETDTFTLTISDGKDARTHTVVMIRQTSYSSPRYMLDPQSSQESISVDAQNGWTSVPVKLAKVDPNWNSLSEITVVVSLSDPDGKGDGVYGRLRADSSDSEGQNMVILTGTLQELNAKLAALEYYPPTDPGTINGYDRIVVTICDFGSVAKEFGPEVHYTYEGGYEFTGEESTAWSDPINWQNNGLPENDDKVLINGKHAVINSGEQYSVLSLAVSNSAALTLDGALSVVGSDKQSLIDGGAAISVSAQGMLDLNGKLLIGPSGALYNNGIVIVEGELSISSSGALANKGTLYIGGDVNQDGQFHNEGTLVIGAPENGTSGGYSHVTFKGDVTFDQGSIIALDIQGDAHDSVTFTNNNGISLANTTISLTVSDGYTFDRVLLQGVTGFENATFRISGDSSDGVTTRIYYRESTKEVRVDITGMEVTADEDKDVIFAGNQSTTFKNLGTGDIAYGGSGYDSFEITSADFTSIDGGAGDDTLWIQGDLFLNLNVLADRVESIEEIILAYSAGDQTYTLDLNSVAQISETNRLHISDWSGSNSFVLTSDGWSQAGMTGDGYTIYSNGAQTVEILVDGFKPSALPSN